MHPALLAEYELYKIKKRKTNAQDKISQSASTSKQLPLTNYVQVNRMHTKADRAFAKFVVNGIHPLSTIDSKEFHDMILSELLFKLSVISSKKFMYFNRSAKPRH